MNDRPENPPPSRPQAWFEVDDPNEHEHFSVGEPPAEPEPAVEPQPTVALPAEEPVANQEPPPLSAEPAPAHPPTFPPKLTPAPEPGSPPNSPALQPPSEPEKQSGQSAHPSLSPPEEDNPASGGHRDSEPGSIASLEIPLAPAALDAACTAPAVQNPEPARIGFSRTELIRLGGGKPLPPKGRLGLLVVVRTPQRVRLGQVYPLRGQRSLLGRGRGVDVLVDDDSVGEIHAVITHEEREGKVGFWLRTAETGPAQVNGDAAPLEAALKTGDRIGLGSTVLSFFEVPLEIEEAAR